VAQVLSERVIVACTNKDCIQNGALYLHARLKEAIAQAQLPLVFDTYKCLGACDYGPNILLYPQLELYSYVTPEDVASIIARVLGGPLPPARLIAELDPESRVDVAEAIELIREDYE